MPTIPANFYRTSIKALILDEQKRFLLLLEKNGLWELPGGGLDYGEHSHACLKRELKEETGWEITRITKQPSYFVSALNIDGLWKTNVLYEVEVKDLKFTPSNECVEYKFFTTAEASKENIYPIVKEFVKEFNPNNHK